MNEANGTERSSAPSGESLSVTVLVAASEIALVRYVLLPSVARALSPEQRNWLREAFSTHPAGPIGCRCLCNAARCPRAARRSANVATSLGSG